MSYQSVSPNAYTYTTTTTTPYGSTGPYYNKSQPSYSPTTYTTYTQPTADIYVSSSASDTYFSPLKNKLFSPAINTSQDVVITDVPLFQPFSILQSAMPMYEDLSKDPEIRDKIVKYFYYKTYDKWLYTDDMFDILSYLKVSNNGENVEILKVSDKQGAANDSQKIVDKKIKYLEKMDLLTKKDVYKILKKIVIRTGCRLVDLPKNDIVVIEAIRKFLKNALAEFKN